MKSTHILLAGVPKLMLDIIEAVIASHSDLHVVARLPADADIGRAVLRHRPDIVILMQPDDEAPENRSERLFQCTPSKVVAIGKEGRTGVEITLRPHATVLGELSADSLIQAIRPAGEA